jgi:hypothetical protein
MMLAAASSVGRVRRMYCSFVLSGAINGAGGVFFNGTVSFLFQSFLHQRTRILGSLIIVNKVPERRTNRNLVFERHARHFYPLDAGQEWHALSQVRAIDRQNILPREPYG